MIPYRFRALGVTILLALLFGSFFWLAWAGRDDAGVSPLYPAGDLSLLGRGGGLQFINGFANW